MKILIVVPGGVHPSGEVKVIPALLSLLKTLSVENEVCIIALNQHRELTEYYLHGCLVISLPNVRFRNIFSAYRIAIARMNHYRFKPEVTHSFWLGSPTIFAAMLCKKLKVPLLASIAGGELVNISKIRYGGYRSFLSRYLIKKSIKMAQASSCGSNYLQSIAVDTVNIRASLIPLGIDREFWPFKVCEDKAENRWNLLQLASINRVKDPWLMLEVVKHLKQLGLPFHLNWVGGDTLNGEIQKLAEKMGLTEFISFHDFVKQKELKQMMAEQHFVIQTSYYESQGIALAEACSQGVCPVGTSVGWLSDLQLGLDFPREILADKIATQIVHLTNAPEERQKRVLKAQSWIKKNDVTITAQKFIDSYNEILTRYEHA
ncbi:glycosyltransferase family 4 protein [Aliikangiella coralliicola]|nr:glycosyltransferase family 4 protein [Aliikangiella coralliicola]